MIAVSRRLAALVRGGRKNYRSRAAGGAPGVGQKIDFSNFVFDGSESRGGSGNHGKTNRASRSGGLAEFRPIPGRLGTHLRCTLADGGERGRGVDQRLEASLRCCRVTPRARGKAPQQTQWGCGIAVARRVGLVEDDRWGAGGLGLREAALTHPRLASRLTATHRCFSRGDAGSFEQSKSRSFQ